MAVKAGNRLGPYEVLSPLGAGGMGEVYRARDARLHREVALKVLPEAVASDPSRLHRFEKEARSASALNHPNIVTVYDIGSEGTISYIAMELVEGKTLRELLLAGPLPVRRMLPIACQTAEGLAKAHEAGIVHRDLKPENLMVTRDGLVKILDFGLAKLASAGAGNGESSQLPTETGTTPGMVVGTVGYMSPEQAGGRPVDYRSDQFSFGSILYEMAAGRRAFHKKTAIDTLAAILNEEPSPLEKASPEVPPPLQWIVERCLRKEPEERYVSTQDLARDLAGVRSRLSEVFALRAGTAEPARSWPRIGAFAAAALLLLAAAFLLGRKGPAAPALTNFHRLTFHRGVISSGRFAPDGRTVLYSALSESKAPRLFLTRPESSESALIDIPDARLLSISPSGEMLILLRSLSASMRVAEDSMLARAAMTGGAPRELLEGAQDAEWSADGKNFAVVRKAGGKSRLEFPMGQTVFETAGSLETPRFSPKGDVLAFLEHPSLMDTQALLWLQDLSPRKGPPTRIGAFDNLTGFAWNRHTSELWFAFARLADSVTEIRGRSLSGTERVVHREASLMDLLDINSGGDLLLSRTTGGRLIRARAPGESAERDLSWLALSFVVDLSGDGRTLLLQESGYGGTTSDVLGMRKTDGSPVVKIGEGTGLALSPDGKWALVWRARPEPAQLVALPTGPGEPRVLTKDSLNHHANAIWTPDGNGIVFLGNEQGRPPRLYFQDLGGGKPRAITPEGIDESSVLIPISPDGKKVAARDPRGRWLIFPVEGGEPSEMLGLAEGETPVQWSAEADVLYVCRCDSPSIEVFKLDLATRGREHWVELRNPEQSPFGILNLHFSRDGKSYAYDYGRYASDLFLAEGMR